MLRVLILAGAVAAFYYSANPDLPTSQTPATDAAARVIKTGDVAAANVTKTVKSISSADVETFVTNPNTPGVILDKGTSSIVAAGATALSWGDAALVKANKWITWWNQAPTGEVAPTN